MRKIVLYPNSPFANIVERLVKDLKQYGSFDGFAVKNVYVSTEKVENLQLHDDGFMISFDVTALSPIDIAIDAIENHLKFA